MQDGRGSLGDLHPQNTEDERKKGTLKDSKTVRVYSSGARHAPL